MRYLLSRPVRGLLVSLLISAVITAGCNWESLLDEQPQTSHEEHRWEEIFRNRNDVLREEALHSTQRLFQGYRNQTHVLADSMEQFGSRWGLFWRWAADNTLAGAVNTAPSLRTRYLTELFRQTVVNEEMLYLHLLHIVEDFATAMELNAAAYFGDAIQSETLEEFRHAWRERLQRETRELARLLNTVMVDGRDFGGRVMWLMTADLAFEVGWYTAMAASLFTPLKVGIPLMLTASAFVLLEPQLRPKIRSYQELAQIEAARTLFVLEHKILHGANGVTGLTTFLRQAQAQFEEAVLAESG